MTPTPAAPRTANDGAKPMTRNDLALLAAMFLVALAGTVLWIIAGEDETSPVAIARDVAQFATGLLFTALFARIYRHNFTDVRKVLIASFAMYTAFTFLKLGVHAGYPDLEVSANVTMVTFFVLLITAGVMSVVRKLKRKK